MIQKKAGRRSIVWAQPNGRAGRNDIIFERAKQHGDGDGDGDEQRRTGDAGDGKQGA